MTQVRTRFAPSPTGPLHIGGLRTALYSFAFAKSQGGQFILRIEDTDRKRFVPGTTEKIYETLKLFGLSWDEGPLVGGPFAPYIQSERVPLGIYQEAAEKLIGEEHAYYCFCQSQESEKISLRDECRDLSKAEIEQKLKSGTKPAVRLRVPDKEKISFYDFVLKKEISWESRDVDEVMLLKSDGFPTYHLAMVTDDAMMKISHVLRGHDWLPSTPAHLLLMKYLDYPVPQIGHLTDILDPEGGKLSKRKGSVSCEEFLAEGYLPEAILNFVMLLGWAPKDNREQFSLEEFVKDFPKGNLQIANPIFNLQKLDWFNGVYIRKKTDQELLSLIKPFAPQNADVGLINKTIPLVKERMNKLSDYQQLAGFFFQKPKVNPTFLGDNAKEYLIEASAVLEKIDNWSKEKIEQDLQVLIGQKGWKTGDFFMNFRIAITGSKITPPITDSVALLGKEETLQRLKDALRI